MGIRLCTDLCTGGSFVVLVGAVKKNSFRTFFISVYQIKEMD